MNRPSPRMILVALLLVFSIGIGCNRVDPNGPIIADVTLTPGFQGPKTLDGRLYLKNDRLRVDWGPFSEIYDLKQRIGRRLIPESKSYMDVGDRDLSTPFPKVTNGSICPNTEVPSECKLVAKEKMNGRMAKKWDILSRHGFHVYCWTDEATGLTLRLEIGKTVYEAKNLRNSSIDDKLFEFPSGYQKIEPPIKY